jgi:hypothetical protein
LHEAAWVLDSDCVAIGLPDFQFQVRYRRGRQSFIPSCPLKLISTKSQTAPHINVRLDD